MPQDPCANVIMYTECPYGFTSQVLTPNRGSELKFRERVGCSTRLRVQANDRYLGEAMLAKESSVFHPDLCGGLHAYLDHTCLLSLKWTLSMITVFDAGSAISALFTAEMELSASVSSGT